MASQSKNWWLPGMLVVAGAVILFVTLKQNPASTHKVVMQEVFDGQSSSPKDPVSSPAIVTSPEHGQEAAFAVQVYSFQDQKRSERALVNLHNNGYPNAYIVVSELGEKGTWYRVRIGGLATEAEAKTILENVRKNYNSGYIIKPKK